MGWWSLDLTSDETSGDAPAEDAGRALEKLANVRRAASKPLPNYDELLAVLAVALGKATRNAMRVSEHQALEGVALVLGDGRVELRAADANAPADEVAIFARLLKDIAAAYGQVADRKPSPREMLTAVNAAVKVSPNPSLLPEETRAFVGFEPILRDDRGVVAETDVIAALAAALRRRAGKLGEIVRGGGAIAITGLGVKPRVGEPFVVPCRDVRANAFIVDDVNVIIDKTVTRHAARGGPLLAPDDLAAALLATLQARSERYDVGTIASLSLEYDGSLGEIEAPKTIRVRHAKFGDGMVVRTVEGDEPKYEIKFDGGESKTLLARFVEVINAGVLLTYARFA